MVALSEVTVDIVVAEDEARFRDLMQAHHYLGAVPGMGETVRYVAHHRGQWLALVVFSAPALKCGARDRWIGWDYGVQFGRLHLVTNNSRFLILPGGPRNLGSRVLSLCTRRLARDWPGRFAIGLVQGRGRAVAETVRNLARNPRRVLDFLKMTANACQRAAPGYRPCPAGRPRIPLALRTTDAAGYA